MKNSIPSRPDRPLTLILMLFMLLSGCVSTISLSDGENRCEYQSKRTLDAESIESVRTIVLDAAGAVRSTRDMVPAVASSESCDGEVCLTLDASGCRASVRR